MLTCLDTYITFSNAVVSDSGLYVNQLPGVNLSMVSDLADEEQTDYTGVWEDVKKRALLKFSLSAKAEFNKCYKIADPAVVECIICGNKELFALALWYFYGEELMIERTSSTRLNRYTTIDLEVAEKLKVDFHIEFQSALSDAVASINPNDSDCVPDALESNDNIRFIESLP